MRFVVGCLLVCGVLVFAVGGAGCDNKTACAEGCPSGQRCVDGRCVADSTPDGAESVIEKESEDGQPTEQNTTETNPEIPREQGGTTVYRWEPAPSGTQADLYGVEMLDATRAWAVGSNGTILHSQDGGKTWSAQTSGVQATLRGVAFVDAQRGWVVGDSGTILRTQDGGKTWNAQNSGVQDSLYRIFFPKSDREYGFAVGDKMTILQSTDAGQSWQTAAKTLNTDLHALFLFDRRSGIFAGKSGLILTTLDAALNFTVAASNTSEQIESLFYPTNAKGWAVGSRGLLLEGREAGRGWQVINSRTTQHLYDIFFVDAQRGWIVGGGGLLWGTRDGAVTWRSEALTSYPDLHSVRVISEQAGVIVGKRGTILALLPVQAECALGSEQPCYTGAAGTEGVGRCKAGKQLCENGFWSSCQGEVVPSGQEICFNGMDDNCNGKSDEEDGCAPCQEGMQQSCYTGPAGTEGRGRCRNGSQRCTNQAWGACQEEILPAQEDCNGQDDDCDGSIDNNLPEKLCDRGIGVCAQGKAACQNGQWQPCTTADYGPDYQDQEDRCDGKDNDCDGVIDEGCPCTQDGQERDCYGGAPGTMGVGPCLGGKQSCTGGSWTGCQGQITPAQEICSDNIDNNCDGRVDERSQFAIACNGQRQYIQVAAASALAPTNALTIEGWFRFDALTVRDPQQALISLAEQGGYALRINPTQRQIIFSVYPQGGNAYVEATAPISQITTTRWHHLAGTFNGTNVTLWIDGKKADEKPLVGQIGYRFTTVPLLFGAEAGQNAVAMQALSFRGQIAEVRVSNAALYSADFTPSCQLSQETSTLGLWRLDEGAGETCADETGAHNGRRIGSSWREAIRCPGFSQGGCRPAAP